MRLGMAFASPGIIRIFNKIKYPYNINLLTQQYVAEMLDKYDQVQAWVRELVVSRDALKNSLSALPIVRKIYPSDANFLLVRFDDAQAVYDYLVGSLCFLERATKREKRNFSRSLGYESK